MSDLISRRAVINEIERWIGYIDGDMIARINIGINKLPSADRPRGEWKEPISYDGLQADYYICSKCRCMRGQASNFCPNCGADMRTTDGGNKAVSTK